MTLRSPARSALRIPYLVVRTPLGLLDEQVVVRVFGADSTVHRSLIRGLHTLDALAASATTTATATATATVSMDDVGKDADDSPVEVITDVQPVERDGGEQPIDAAEQEEIEQLTDAFLAEDELTPRSGELAENDELRRVQAKIRAKQAIETEHGQL